MATVKRKQVGPAKRKRNVAAAASPLPLFRDVAELATLEFTKLEVTGATLYESTMMDGDKALRLWRSAETIARAEGLTAVLVVERTPADMVKVFKRYIPESLAALKRMKGTDVLAARERDLRDNLDEDDEDDGDDGGGLARLERMRRELRTAKITDKDRKRKGTFYVAQSGRQVCLTLLTCEPWQVVLYLPVGGFNDAPMPVELAAVVRDWSRSWDLVPVYVGGDTLELEARAGATVEELREIAWQHYLLCTDIVEQGAGSVAKLAKEIAVGRWFFWWD